MRKATDKAKIAKVPQFPMTDKAQVGDIIRIPIGVKLYTDIPEHFAYANRRGSWVITHAEAKVEGELSYLAGDYMVTCAEMNGGGRGGHNPSDVYPDGWHVTAVSQDGKIKIDFYQSGCFICKIEKVAVVGKGEPRLVWGNTK